MAQQPLCAAPAEASLAVPSIAPGGSGASAPTVPASLSCPAYLWPSAGVGASATAPAQTSVPAGNSPAASLVARSGSMGRLLSISTARASAAGASAADAAGSGVGSAPGAAAARIRNFSSFCERGAMDQLFPLRCHASEHVEICEKLHVPPQLHVRTFPINQPSNQGAGSSSRRSSCSSVESTGARSRRSSLASLVGAPAGEDGGWVPPPLMRGATESLAASLSAAQSAEGAMPAQHETRAQHCSSPDGSVAASPGLLRKAASTSNALQHLVPPSAQEAT
jgi:hypothetical protein